MLNISVINHKYFVIRNFMTTCSSVEILKEYMLICQNAEGLHGQRKVGNPCARGLFNALEDSALTKFFGFGFRFFCKWRCKRGRFLAILAQVTCPRPKYLAQV